MRLITDDAIAVCTVWQEARNQIHDGKVAVGEVIRNRMKLGHFSDGTVIGTCLKPYQFSGWNSADRNRIPSLLIDDADPVVAECVLAWEESEKTTLTKGSIFYINPVAVIAQAGKLPKWWDIDGDPSSQIVIGDHYFRRRR